MEAKKIPTKKPLILDFEEDMHLLITQFFYFRALCKVEAYLGGCRGMGLLLIVNRILIRFLCFPI